MIPALLEFALDIKCMQQIVIVMGLQKGPSLKHACPISLGMVSPHIDASAISMH